MGKSRAKKSCYENLRRYNALDDELQVCQSQLDLLEAPPVIQDCLIEDPSVPAPPVIQDFLIEGPSVPEVVPNAGIDTIMMRIDKILGEMNTIENRIFEKDSVYVNQVGDLDALLKISGKKGQYRGLVKVRPADAATKLYFMYNIRKGNFNSDMF